VPHTPFDAPPAVRAAIDAFLRGLDPSDPFLAVVQHSITAIVVSDPTLPDNPLIYVNDAFTALTGFDAVEVLGRNCRFMQGPLTASADVERLRTAIRRRERIGIDLLNHRRDGTPFWNRLMVAPVFDAAGDLRYFVASQLDVTIERHRLQQLQHDRDSLNAELEKREALLAEREARLAMALNAGGRIGVLPGQFRVSGGGAFRRAGPGRKPAPGRCRARARRDQGYDRQRRAL
jgi:PAS domain S-box-containing protein